MLWSERFSPRKLSEFTGNSKAIAAILAWAREWEKGKRPQPLLLHGATGTGKTAITRALATELGWGVVELNAGALRNKAAISRTAGNALTTSSLSHSRRLLLIDDIDAMFASDRGGLSELVRLISSAEQPMLLTAQDYWEPKLAPLRSICKAVAFTPIPATELETMLEKIAAKAGIKPPAGMLAKMASTSNGDARSAINDLQAYAEGNVSDAAAGPGARRDRVVEVKDGLAAMFAAENFESARSAVYDVDLDHDMLFKWIEENVPRVLATGEELARAFELLSRASLFDSRAVRRQYYALWRYSGDLMSAGVSLSRSGAPAKPTMQFQFPRSIIRLSQTRASRAILKSTSTKIARKLHTSSRRATIYFPVLAALAASGGGRQVLKNAFELEDSELSLLTGMSK